MQKATSEKFNISVHTAFKIKRQRKVITRHADTLKTTEGNVRKRKSMKQQTKLELENRIYDWFNQKRSQGIPISGLIFQEKALQINTELGSDTHFTASSGWQRNYEARHGIRQLSVEGEILSPILHKFLAVLWISEI